MRKFGTGCGTVLLWLLLAGCASQPEREREVESVNQDSRVNMVVIHHTAEDFEGSLDILTQPSERPVSSHYLIPEPADASYAGQSLAVYTLVPETRRAWHAGTSHWKGMNGINNISIGIELVNQAHCHAAGIPAPPDAPVEPLCFFPDYAESQISLLADLLAGILERNPEIKPTHIVGHSDIAPQRKVDPGPRFPWQRLYQLGYGAWYDDATVLAWWQRFNHELPSLDVLQQALGAWGYAIDTGGVEDQQSRNVVRAFQHHFRPWNVHGQLDAETAAVLFALLEKYYPEELVRLPGDFPPVVPAPLPETP